MKEKKLSKFKISFFSFRLLLPFQIPVGENERNKRKSNRMNVEKNLGKMAEWNQQQPF